jgi:transposase-like protein
MSLEKRREFTREFKLRVLNEISAGKSVAQAAREHQLRPNLISRWQNEKSILAERAFSGNGNSQTEAARIADLERKVGQLTMENDLLKKVLTHLEDPAS